MEDSTSSKIRSKHVIYSIFLFVFLLFPFCFRLCDLVSIDEMMFILDGERMMHGESLYVDISQSLDPLTHWITATLFSVLGPSLILTRLTYAIVWALLCVVAWRRFRKKNLSSFFSLVFSAAMSSSLLLFFAISHHLTCTVLALAVLLLIDVAIDKPNSKVYWVIAGAVLAAMPMAHIVKGAGFVLAVALWIILRFAVFRKDVEKRKEVWQQAGGIFLGFVLMGVLLFLILGITSDLQSWFKETIVRKQQYVNVNLFAWPMFRTSVHKYSIGQVLQSPALAAVFFQQQFHFILPIILLLLLGLTLYREGLIWLGKDVRFLAVIGAVSFWVGTMYHCAPSRFLMIIPLVLYAIGGLLSLLPNVKSSRAVLGLSVILTIMVAKNYLGVLKDWNTNGPLVSTSLGNMCLTDASLHDDTMALKEYLEKHGIKEAFCYPNPGWVYFWCNLRNPTAYSALYRTVNNEADVLRVKKTMAESRCRYIIYQPDGGEPFAAMDDWIENDFQVVFSSGALQLVELKSSI